MKKIDINKHVTLVRSPDSRTADDKPDKCEVCGVTIFITERLMASAKATVAAMGREPILTCQTCMQPMIDEIATGKASIAGPANTLGEYMPALMKARRRFFQESN